MTTHCCPSQYEVSQAELDLYKGKFTSGEDQLREAREKQAAIGKEAQAKKKQATSTEQSLPAKRKELAQCEAEMKVRHCPLAPLGGGGGTSRGGGPQGGGGAETRGGGFCFLSIVGCGQDVCKAESAVSGWAWPD